MDKIVIFIAIILFYCNNVLALSDTEINGKVNTYRDSGLTFYALDIKEDSRPIFLFPVSDLDSHPAGECIKFSLDNNSNIVLSGTLEKEGEYLSFKDGKFICINKNNDSNNKNEFSNNTSPLDLVGPKIFNLQIGMSANEAKPYIDEICRNLNLKLDKNKNGKKYGCDYSQCSISIDKGIVTKYQIPLKAFNFTSTGKKEYEEFLRNFITHYNIPTLEVEISQNMLGDPLPVYYYTSPKDGWKILLDKRNLYVNSIPKSSSVIFK